VLGTDLPSLSPLTPKTFKNGGKAELIVVGFSKAITSLSKIA
jgi:hypothetical protein